LGYNWDAQEKIPFNFLCNQTFFQIFGYGGHLEFGFRTITSEEFIFLGYNGDAQVKVPFDFLCDPTSGYPDIVTNLNLVSGATVRSLAGYISVTNTIGDLGYSKLV
jgi:hypothetical protein